MDRERGTECAYEPRQRSHRVNSGTLPIPCETASHRHPLNVRPIPSTPPAAGFSFSEPLTNLSLSAPHLTWSNPSESASSPSPPSPLAHFEWPLASSSRVHGEIAVVPSSDVSVTQDIHSTTERIPHPIASTFTILPSIQFRRIPRPLPVPPSLIPQGRVQISSNAEGDLDMTLYVLFRFLNSHPVVGTKLQSASRLRSLCRINRLGVYFGPEKQDALFRGDTSNAIVNRYFVYGLWLAGAYLCGALDESSPMLRLLERNLQKAWEALIEIYRGDDQRLAAQGLLMLMHSLIVVVPPSEVQSYLPKLYELINNGNLRFLPAYGRPPELSDQVREDAAVLSQAIYLENYFYLALNGPAPARTTRIEREFRGDFQVRTICCWVRGGLNDLA